jgi:hypothetical protein
MVLDMVALCRESAIVWGSASNNLFRRKKAGHDIGLPWGEPHAEGVEIQWQSEE